MASKMIISPSHSHGRYNVPHGHPFLAPALHSHEKGSHGIANPAGAKVYTEIPASRKETKKE